MQKHPQQPISVLNLYKCSLFLNIKAVFSSQHHGSFKSHPITLERGTGYWIQFSGPWVLFMLFLLIIIFFYFSKKTSSTTLGCTGKRAKGHTETSAPILRCGDFIFSSWKILSAKSTEAPYLSSQSLILMAIVAGVKGLKTMLKGILLTPVIKQLVDFSVQNKVFSNYPIKSIWRWTCKTGPTKLHKSLRD